MTPAQAARHDLYLRIFRQWGIAPAQAQAMALWHIATLPHLPQADTAADLTEHREGDWPQ